MNNIPFLELMMKDAYLQCAFDAVCKEAIVPKAPEDWYVALVERTRIYLGPEEGGNWGDATEVQAYQRFDSEELARTAAEKVKILASELQTTARTEHGQHCLRQMEWLDQRGLEADFLPENDGPAEYEVSVSQGIPENYYPSRGYE